MPAKDDLAICVRLWDWSETSQTVSLFGRALGLVRCLAKGAKRPTAAFSGGLELLTLGEAALLIKPASELALLTRWELTETFPALRRDLAAHAAGQYMAELVLRFAADHDPHPGLFDALVRGLRTATSSTTVPAALLEFQWAALSEAGYEPVLDRLIGSGEKGIPVATIYQFDPARGGIVGPAELAAGGGTSGGQRSADPDWMLRLATLDALRSLRAGSGPSVTTMTPETIGRAARFLAAYARHVLGSQPATLAWVFPELASTGSSVQTRGSHRGRHPP